MNNGVSTSVTRRAAKRVRGGAVVSDQYNARMQVMITRNMRKVCSSSSIHITYHMYIYIYVYTRENMKPTENGPCLFSRFFVVNLNIIYIYIYIRISFYFLGHGIKSLLVNASLGLAGVADNGSSTSGGKHDIHSQ